MPYWIVREDDKLLSVSCHGCQEGGVEFDGSTWRKLRPYNNKLPWPVDDMTSHLYHFSLVSRLIPVLRKAHDGTGGN